MRSFQKLVFLSFLSLTISSFAHVSLSLVTITQNHEIIDPLLKGWCNTSAYPHLCVFTIAPHIKENLTLHDALDIAIKSGIKYTNNTIFVAEEVAKAPPPTTKGAVDLALEMLNMALSAYIKAQDYLNQHKYGEINNQLSGVSSSLSTALDPNGPDPKAEEIKVPVLRIMLHKGEKIVDVCLAFSTLLNPQPSY